MLKKSIGRGLGLLAVVGILSSSAIRAEERRYTLQDLQALEGRKAWSELLEHLEDIAPSARDAQWNHLVEVSCIREDLDDALAEACGEELKTVLESDPKNTVFAWKAGKWARRKLMSWAAVPFFARAIEKTGDARCSDDDVLQAIVSGLGLPADGNKEIVTQSQTLAFQTCWPASKESVKNAFSADSGYLRDNACHGLKDKGALSDLQAKRCDQKKQ